MRRREIRIVKGFGNGGNASRYSNLLISQLWSWRESNPRPNRLSHKPLVAMIMKQAQHPVITITLKFFRSARFRSDVYSLLQCFQRTLICWVRGLRTPDLLCLRYPAVEISAASPVYTVALITGPCYHPPFAQLS
jgi:hypothetical protein